MISDSHSFELGEKGNFTPPKEKNATIENRDQIISCVTNLLFSAQKLKTGSRFELSDQTLKSFQATLEADDDICERLTDVTKKHFDTPIEQERQLREIQNYLSLLVTHATQQKDAHENRSNLKILNSLNTTVTSAVNQYAKWNETPWKSELERMENIIKLNLDERKTSNPLHQTQSVLLTHTDMDIDEKIFANHLLEAMITGSNLEGNADGVVIDHIYNYLKANEEKFKDIEKYPLLLKLYSDMKEYNEAMQLDVPLQNINESNFESKFMPRFNAFYDKLSTKINQLQEGEMTMLPAGWTGERGGHSIKVGIERRENGNFCVRIYNSGDGLQDYHYSITEKGNTLYQPYLEISGISEENLLDPEFWQAYLEILTVSNDPYQYNSATQYGAKEFYGLFMNALGGKVEPSCGIREKFMVDQFSGTCTFSSNQAVWHTLLPPKDFSNLSCNSAFDDLHAFNQKLNIESREKNLSEIDMWRKEEKLSESDKWAREKIQMLQYGSENTAQIALDAYENKSISFDQLCKIYATLTDLKNKLDSKIVGEYRIEGRTENKDINFNRLTETSVSEKEKKLTMWSISTPESNEFSINAKPESPLKEFSFSWLDDPNKIVDGMGSLLKYLENGYDGVHNAEAIATLEKFFIQQSKLDVKKIWDEIPNDQLPQATVLLADLGEWLFNAAAENPNRIKSYRIYGLYLSALMSIIAPKQTLFQKTNVDFSLDMVQGVSFSGYVEEYINDNQNIYNPEERELFRQLLNIHSSQKKSDSHFRPSFEEHMINYLNKIPAPRSSWEGTIKYSNDEFEMIDDFLKEDHTLKEKLENQFSSEHPIPGSSNEKYIGLGLCDWYGKVLPPHFCAFRRLAATVSLLNENKTLERKPESTFSSKIESSGNDVTFKYLCTPNIPQRKKTDFSENLLVNSSIRKRQNDSTIKVNEKDLMLQEAEVEKRNQRIILSGGDGIDDSNTCPEQQLIKVVSHYKSNFELLEKPEERQWFRALLFEQDFLETVLEKNPHFSVTLKGFLEQCFRHFVENADIPAAMDFIELLSACDAIAHFQKASKDLLPIRDNLIKLLGQNWKQPDALTLIYQQIAASYKTHPPSTFTEKDAIQLLTALTYDKVFSLKTLSSSVHVEEGMKGAYQLWKGEIEKLLKSEHGNQICNAIVRSLETSASEMNWDCSSSYPFCKSQDGSYVLNINTQEVFKRGQIFTGLPKGFFNHPEFTKLFCQTHYPSKPLDNGFYEFVDERGITTRIKEVKGEAPIIQQELSGEWHQLTDALKLEVNLPNSFNKLCKQSTLWRPMGEGNRILIKDLSLKTTHYINLGLTEDKYRKIESIEKITGEDKSLFLRDVCLPYDINKTFKDLYDVGMIWRDKNGDLKEFELPSLGLSFAMQKNDKVWLAMSAEYPGYHVASNQRCRGMEDIPGSVVLENHQGKRKLILPFGTIISSSDPDNPSPFNISLKLKVEDNANQKLIAYDLDALSRPTFKTREQQLYMAMILFSQKKYKEAQNLLQQSYTQIKSYNDVELELLKNIIVQPLALKDASPHAGAVVMTALSLMSSVGKKKITELQENQRIGNTEMEGLLNLYRGYKKLLGTIPDLRLPINAEREALECLQYQLTSGKTEDPNVLQLAQIIAKEISLVGNDEIAGSIAMPSFTQPVKKKSSLQFNSIRKGNYWPTKAQGLITSPPSCNSDLALKWYEAALNDPKKLELYLVGGELSRNIPIELIKLLRCVAQANEVKKSGKINDLLKDFPPTLKEFESILDAFNSDRFDALIKRSQELEKTLMTKSPVQEVELTGAASPKHPSKAEAQRIGVRSEFKKGNALDKIPDRLAMLPKGMMNKFEKVESGALKLTKKEIADLQNSVAVGSDGKVQSSAQELADNIATFWKQGALDEQWHKIPIKTPAKDLPVKTPEKNLPEEIKTLLLVNRAEKGKIIARKEQELLALANSLPKEQVEALFFEMEKMGRQRQMVTINDLILLAARSGHFTLVGKNPNLASLEKKLIQETLLYLDAKAEQQQIGRALTHVNTLLETKDSKTYDLISEMLYQELTRKPPYNAHEHPEFLVFEVLDEKGLYPWQCNDLERMLSPKTGENPNVILEKVMGSGKTKVYLPLLALGKADGESIPFIVVHTSQYDTVGDALQIGSGQMFEQVAHTLKFTRDSDTSVTGLKKILDECREVQQKRHFFVVTDKTLHSLWLASDLLWDEYLSGDKENKDLAERIGLFKEILNVFKNNGKAILDEADLLLNCRFEVVYALGEPQEIDAEHRNIVASLYKSIAPQLAELQPYTDESYKAIKPKMIQAFIDNVVKKEMKECDSEKVAAYLKGEKIGFEYVEKLSDIRRNQLAIILYEFNDLLPIVLDRRCGEHYGYSNSPSKVLPVPYVASGVPSASAEFSFPYALLNYTVQTLVSEGVPFVLLKQIINRLRNQALNEQKLDHKLSLTDTQAYKEFLKLCGDKISIPFLKTEDSDIEKLVNIYKTDPPEPYEFAKTYLFPAVTMHGRKLASTPFTLANFFAESQGFTGTPWNSATYPKNLQTIRDVNSAGKTQGIIWKNSQKVHNEITSTKFKNIMNDIAVIQKDGSYHAFIDVGALFNGISNQEVAKEFLANLPVNIQGVLFFKDNLPYVLQKDNKLIPYSQCGLGKEQLYIFYDQWHTTGTDFPIAGKSLLSIGKNTKMRDLEQGYMRDREAARGPRVEFILGPEAQKFIQKQQNLGEQKIGTNEILRCSQINQDSELKDQLITASFDRMKECINQHLHQVLLHPSITPSDVYQKREEILKLIGEAAKDAPYEQFGKYQEVIDRKEEPEKYKEYFENIIDQMIKKAFSGLCNDATGFKMVDEVTLKKELWNCIDLKLMPEKISSAVQNSPEQLVEQQSQQETQQERMAMSLKDMETDAGIQKNGALHWNWNLKGDLSGERFYRIIKPQAIEQETLPSVSHWGEKEVKNQTPIFSIDEIFKGDETLKNFSDVFSIEATYNFLPNKGIVPNDKIDNRQGFSEVDARPFEKGQLPVSNLLIRHDMTHGGISPAEVMLISNADAAFFFHKLAEDRSKNKIREYHVALYNMNLGVIQSNSNAILENKEVLIDKVVKSKIVQAKFFNGESSYNKEEFEILTTWIKDKGSKRMEELFCDHILRNNKEKKKDYIDSPLAQLFFKLNKKE